MKNVDKYLLLLFILLRCCSLVLVQTWFIPDETWQVTEVAHHWVYKYGWLTWEWKESIRSILYPGVFAGIFYILKILRLDNKFFLIHSPRLVSAIFFAYGDYCIYKLSSSLYGKSSAYWTSACLCTSWFLAYCAPRTMSSCFEMVLLAMALQHYPWKNEKNSLSTKYLWLSGIGCIIRPTLVLTLMPFCLKHFILSRNREFLLSSYCIKISVVCLGMIILDTAYYESLTFTPWNFLKFNVFSGLSSHYGTHPWHWYLTQGLPIMCAFHLPLIIFGSLNNFRKHLPLLIPCLWTIFVYSCLGHKEFRFLLPILPLLFCISGDVIQQYLRTSRKDLKSQLKLNRKHIFGLLIIPNLALLLYTGLVHQRGPLDLIDTLHNKFKNHVKEFQFSKQEVLFLMPCHSTPLYSHLHLDIPVRFLTCEPNFADIKFYQDEAEIFYEDPGKWIRDNYGEHLLHEKYKLPSCLAMFDELVDELEWFIEVGEYRLSRIFFHSHFEDGNRSTHIHLYCQAKYNYDVA